LPIFLLGGALALTGCSDRGTDPTDPGSPGGDEVSYAVDVQPIFDAGCIGCHGDGGSGGLDLRAPGSRSKLVGIASTAWPGDLVTAGEPDQSVLYLKLIGAGGVGDRMPQGGALGDTDTETVRRWIAEGALDN